MWSRKDRRCVASFLPVFGLAAGMLIGMPRPSVAAVTVESVRYAGWDGSYRLTNGTVEVVIVPAAARILRYGYVGGPNLLWNNPVAAGKPAKPGEWPNFGGDKAWPWPQYDWPQRIGHDWPPPEAADQVAYTAEIVGSDTVRMTSPLVIGFGLRIVRDITLARTGTRLTIVTRLEKVRAGDEPPVAAWAITQIVVPDALLAHLTAGSPLPDGWKQLGFDPFASLSKTDGVLRIVRAKDRSSKIGIDADALAALFGDTLLTIRSSAVDTPASFLPGERAQIYAGADSADDLRRGITPYVELELTSPKRALPNPGDTVTLTTLWDLRRLPPGIDPAKALSSGG